MNYRVLVSCPHELPCVIPNPIKLPNPSQQPPFFHFCPPFYKTIFLYPKYPQKNAQKIKERRTPKPSCGGFQKQYSQFFQTIQKQDCLCAVSLIQTCEAIQTTALSIGTNMYCGAIISNYVDIRPGRKLSPEEL
jgi:hypothetical protein